MLDSANVRRERESALEKSANAQKADGSFPWFPGGPSSDSITLYLLNALRAPPLEASPCRRTWCSELGSTCPRSAPGFAAEASGRQETELGNGRLFGFRRHEFPRCDLDRSGLTKDEVNELVEAVFCTVEEAVEVREGLLGEGR